MSHLLSVDDLLAVLGPWTHRPGPLYARLADALRDAIDQAALEDGQRLPAERLLAGRLGVSRGTVVAAYAALAEQHVVARRRGSGTTVTHPAQARPGRHHRFPQLSRFVSGVDVPIDLSFGAPHFDELVAEVSAEAADAMRGGMPVHGYAPLGLPALREGVAALLSEQGVATSTAEVMITPGAQGALQLITAALVRRGDRVIVEAPTYPGALELFSRAGAVVVGVRRDHAGPRLDDLERVLAVQPPALVFVVPTCHNPTGTVMREQRRRELLALCARHEVIVLEDHTLAHLLFTGTAPPPLAAMAPENVIMVGSFSKMLWGGLRTGWIRADPATTLRLGRLKAAQDLGSGTLDQVACLRAIDRLPEIVRARREAGAARHAALSRALAEQLPEWRQHPCQGGYSLWAQLPDAGAEQVVAAALRQGVALASGAASAPDDMFLDHLRLCFAAEPAVLEEAVARLRIAWAELARPAPVLA